MSKIHLYYWGVPGKGQPIRFLLEYLGLPYEETRYTEQTANDWFAKDKQQVGFDFPNLPAIIDGKTNFTENHVISSYLPFKAGKLDLNGKGVDEFKVEEVKNVASDAILQVYIASLEKDNETKQKIYKEKVQPKVQFLQKFYKGKQWGLGYLTVADFYAYSLVQHTREVFVDEWKAEFTDFLPFIQRFEALPQIQSYQKSDRYIPYRV